MIEEILITSAIHQTGKRIDWDRRLRETDRDHSVPREPDRGHSVLVKDAEDLITLPADSGTITTRPHVVEGEDEGGATGETTTMTGTVTKVTMTTTATTGKARNAGTTTTRTQMIDVAVTMVTGRTPPLGEEVEAEAGDVGMIRIGVTMIGRSIAVLI